ncbi:MAG: sigma-54 dependent transcriptional regulator [Candidatus Neomarinimicrobiota bacterium]
MGDGLKPKLLIIDDEQSVLNALKRSLRDHFEVLLSLDARSGLEILREQEISVIFADQRMPGMSGVEFFQNAMKIQPDSARILITGYSDIEAIIEAINNGQIYYYIQKPWEPENIVAIAKGAAERYDLIQENRRLVRELSNINRQLGEENVYLKREVEKQFTFDTVIGESPAIKKVLDLAKKVVHTDTTVLLTGETGTGKDVIARVIHFNSPRKDEMFIAQNCSALPDTLLESELFGHVKGAFTDAVDDKKGLFKIADNGTVFLDELADTSQAFQQRLLRVLQSGEFHPLGSEQVVKVDVRVISATNRDLTAAMQQGQFREDLYYRLNVFPIHIPPLRERIEDVPLLADYFLKKSSVKLGKKCQGLSSEAIAYLLSLEYPGNVRELENLIERALVLVDEEVQIGKEHFRVDDFFQNQHQPQADSQYSSLKQATEALEKDQIIRILSRYNHNISKTASVLGLSRPGLYKKMKRYSIE